MFAYHRQVIDALCKYLDTRNEGYIKINGTTNFQDRHERVQEFQTSGSCRVGVLSITAAGVCLTLTAASTILFAEMYWNPGALLQAEDRVHRIGQRSAVQVYYFYCADTIDEFLWQLLQKKMSMLGEFIEGKKNGWISLRATDIFSQDSDWASDPAKHASTGAVQIDDNILKRIRGNVRSFFYVLFAVILSFVCCCGLLAVG